MSRDTRRGFIRRAALAGGTAMVAPQLFAQATPSTPPYPDPNEVCTPPTYNNPPVNNQPMPVPVKYTPWTRPVQQRKSAWQLSASELTRLNAAYAKLRALPADDPRGWLPQAHVHCFYCSGAQDNPSNTEIHGGWYFMPWHRAYLHFHERILANLVGDDTFTLPYWDWDNTPHTLFPPPYAAQPALIDTFRFTGASPTDPKLTLAAQFAHYGVDVAQLLQDSDYELFMGTAPDQFNNYGGNIENGPHGLVHVWVGDPALDFGNPMPDMGILQTAARDPVFFAHHCNIDKLWWTWSGSSPDHANPTDCRWSQQRWTFYDENKNWVWIAAEDVVDPETQLAYTYGPTASANKTTSNKVILSSEPKTTRQTPAPTTKEITAPSGTTPHTALRTRQPRLILHIDGIQIPQHLGAIVRVFVNLPSATAETPATSPNYVGYFVITPKTGRGATTQHQHGRNETNIALNVTDKLPALLQASNNKLTVTLVPTTGARKAPANIDMTYEKVWIETK